MISTVYLVADKLCSVIKIDITLNSIWEAILLLSYSSSINIWLYLITFSYFVLNNSFIMLVNILLFQHYSCQICNLLFSIGSGLYAAVLMKFTYYAQE